VAITGWARSEDAGNSGAFRYRRTDALASETPRIRTSVARVPFPSAAADRIRTTLEVQKAEVEAGGF